MTNYIEEMMKTAGCKTSPLGCTNEDINEYTDYISNDCEGDCIDCTWYDSDEYYPDFTAEKQLEIIKLIANQNKSVIITSGLVDHEAGFLITKDSLAGGISVANKDFAQALAQLTTELMKAGGLDKDKVKGILGK